MNRSRTNSTALSRPNNRVSYRDSLTAADKEAYEAKLRLSNYISLPDPYEIPENEWCKDVSKWPSIEWPDIYTYLIDKPSVFTKEKLRAYKSLDAYNYVLCGHVQGVKYFTEPSLEFCALKAGVLPSQRQGTKTQLYEAWIYVHKRKGYILTANCTCMAGLASCCTHAAAVMFKVEMAVRLGFTETACTSKSCQWNDMSRRQVEPVPLSAISFKKPKRKAASSCSSSVVPTPVSRPQQANFKVVDDADVVGLKSIFPAAAVLTSTENAGSDTDSASESEENMEILPEPITAVYEPSAITLPAEELIEKCDQTMHHLNVSTTEESVNALEKVTKAQAKCLTWHIHRQGRITGSTFHRIVCLKEGTDRKKVVDMLMGYNAKPLNVPAVQWGKSMEETARTTYLATVSHMHENFKIEESGFLVKRDMPFLGASPDGIIHCKCCGTGVLELKCPYKYRDGLDGSAEDATFCLCTDNTLKRTHQYFYQVQLQMFVYNVTFCDFFLWTKPTAVLIRIGYDDNFIQMLLPRVEQFFKQHVLPELLTRSNDPTLVRDEACTSCERPSFGKMARCSCCLGSYHYECVNMHRACKNWVCVSCRHRKL